jgi:hypothetical protein
LTTTLLFSIYRKGRGEANNNHIEKMKIILTLLKISAVCMLVYAATTVNEYEFYEIQRWYIIGTFSYFSFISYKESKYGQMIFFLFGMALFNPFKHPVFEDATWKIVDSIFAISITISILLDHFENRKISIDWKSPKTRRIIRREFLIFLITIGFYGGISSVIIIYNNDLKLKHSKVNNQIDSLSQNLISNTKSIEYSRIIKKAIKSKKEESSKLFLKEISFNDIQLPVVIFLILIFYILRFLRGNYK